MRKIFVYIILVFCCTNNSSFANAEKKIVVSKTGKANFRTIQAAINSLSDSSSIARLIYIKNGVYDEKIYIDKHQIILRGESREKTIIQQSIARDEWRCSNPSDWGVATINVNGNDISLESLTVLNNYGFDHLAQPDKSVDCPNDSSGNQQKKIRFNSHQMALRTMNTTRLKAINCRFRAYAGDTVSPWNVQDGMFYFKDCIMEGGVDFYCPRGWAFAENCKFITHSGDAAIWHDGSGNKDSKTVLLNCSFEGKPNFNLGRYHRDAQFYLINCAFSKDMSNKDIFLVPTDNVLQWGRRVYYYNCHKVDGNYAWFADNLDQSAEKITVDKINPYWLFGNRWNPLSN